MPLYIENIPSLFTKILQYTAVNPTGKPSPLPQNCHPRTTSCTISRWTCRFQLLPCHPAPQLSAVYEEASLSGPTLRSAFIRGTSGGIASGIIDALTIGQAPSGRRVAPNLVSLRLDDIGADLCTGIHPIRTIGEAIEADNRLPVIEELVFLNCPALEKDVKPLAAALKKGNAEQLRVLSWDNSQDGSPESSTNLLLEALASGACRRPRVETLTFADGWSVANAPLTHLREALKACAGLRKLVFDCSSRPASELLGLSYAIAVGDIPNLEYACLRISEQDSNEKPQQAIEILAGAASAKVPPVRLEVKMF